MIKAILSDLGNVIVFTNHRKITEGLARYTDKDESQVYDFFVNSNARKGFEKGRVSPQQLFADFKDNLDLRLNFNKFNEIWCSCFLGLNKEMEKLLYRLKKNYRLVLLSNTDEMHFNYLRKKYSVLDIFDGYVLSCQEGCKKPNPMIYFQAIKKAKAMPGQIVYMDDVYAYVIAAKIFGIKGIQYKTFDKLKIDLRQNYVKA
ncbi:HAD hydrolase-like protein [Candidatus Woesearchaeota archaeon]|nr:HAD hydrolase-like protein [Candidatus Woesearchaeota archaeon]